MEFCIWLLPLIFMGHDFEEILFLMPWVEKNQQYLQERFPKFAGKILSHYNSLTYSAFALIVAEEFLVISGITVITALFHTYWLWFAAFMGFSIHLFIHVCQWLVFRRYVPVIVTSLLALPYSYFAFERMVSSGLLTNSAMVMASVFGFLLVVLNYLLATLMARRFSRWQRRYFSAVR